MQSKKPWKVEHNAGFGCADDRFSVQIKRGFQNKKCWVSFWVWMDATNGVSHENVLRFVQTRLNASHKKIYQKVIGNKKNGFYFESGFYLNGANPSLPPLLALWKQPTP